MDWVVPTANVLVDQRPKPQEAYLNNKIIFSPPRLAETLKSFEIFLQRNNKTRFCSSGAFFKQFFSQLQALQPENLYVGVFHVYFSTNFFSDQIVYKASCKILSPTNFLFPFCYPLNPSSLLPLI